MLTPPWALPAELWMSLGLTLKLALVSTTLLMLMALPLGAWLASARSRLALGIEILIAMPPRAMPSVTGGRRYSASRCRFPLPAW
jgi:molybdate transport system permease protein